MLPVPVSAEGPTPADVGTPAVRVPVAGFSKFHFHRLFVTVYGLTPAQHLSQRRIERAKDYLRATNLTVTEVCAAVGFSSLGSFSSRFSQTVGETPSAFRARHARSGPPRVPGCFVFMRGVAATTTQRELDVHLTTPGPPLSPEFAASINRALDEGGTFSLGLHVDDCVATIADLEAKGVAVINPPEQRPYGVEALIRDNSGNWIVLVEPRDFTPEEMADFAGDDPSQLNPLPEAN